MKKININYSRRNIGAAAITAVLFFVIISSVFALGLSSPVVRNYTTARDLGSSKGAYYLSEAGLEDVIYRHKKGIPVISPVILSLGGDTAVTNILDISPTEKEITSAGSVSSNTRHMSTVLSKTTGVSFFYGMQVGSGGLELRDDAVINGNVYSNGDVDGDSDSEDMDYIYGNLVVAGAHDVDNAHISGTVYADEIDDSYIGGDAYYEDIDYSSIVHGVKYPGTPNQPQTTFAITDEMVAQWEAAAEAGGTTYCPSDNYNLSGSVTLGPRKFMRSSGGSCDLHIDDGVVLTLTGPIWVYGDITIGGNAVVKVSPSLEGQSVALIADGHHSWTDEIDVGEHASFQGSGENSYVTLISMETSDSPSIDMVDDASGDIIAFAPYGYIKIDGNVNVKEVSAKEVRLSGEAVLDYETGVASLLFNSGQTGTWETLDWKLGQ